MLFKKISVFDNYDLDERESTQTHHGLGVMREKAIQYIFPFFGYIGELYSRQVSIFINCTRSFDCTRTPHQMLP